MFAVSVFLHRAQVNKTWAWTGSNQLQLGLTLYYLVSQQVWKVVKVANNKKISLLLTFCLNNTNWEPVILYLLILELHLRKTNKGKKLLPGSRILLTPSCQSRMLWCCLLVSWLALFHGLNTLLLLYCTLTRNMIPNVLCYMQTQP